MSQSLSRTDEINSSELVVLFEQRLKALPFLPIEEGTQQAVSLRLPHGGRILRMAVALVIHFEVPLCELWIEDSASLPSYPWTHDAAKQRADNYFLSHRNHLVESYQSAFVLETSNYQRFLLVETDAASGIEYSIRWRIDEWLALITAYKLSGIIGKFPEEKEIDGEGVSRRHIVGKFLLQSEGFDKTREKDYLNNIAIRYGMTYFQYLRFRMYAGSMHEAGIGIGDEVIAKDLVSEPVDI